MLAEPRRACSPFLERLGMPRRRSNPRACGSGASAPQFSCGRVSTDVAPSDSTSVNATSGHSGRIRVPRGWMSVSRNIPRTRRAAGNGRRYSSTITGFFPQALQPSVTARSLPAAIPARRAQVTWPGTSRLSPDGADADQPTEREPAEESSRNAASPPARLRCSRSTRSSGRSALWSHSRSPATRTMTPSRRPARGRSPD